MTIKGDPDQLAAAAKGVMTEPYAYVKRAHDTIAGDCHLNPIAFGIAPSVVLSGPYESARSTLEKTASGGVDAFTGLAQGLVNVARLMAGAEAANTVMPAPQHADLQPTGISADGSGAATTEAGVFATEVSLLMEWIAVGGVLAACGALAPTALAAVVTWGLVTPDDGSLSTAISAWQSAHEDIGRAADYLEPALKPIDDGGWPDEDTTRQAFDKWQIPFNEDVGKLGDAAGAMGDALKSAVDGIHSVQTDAFLTASIALGAIIVLTAMDGIPGAAAITEPAKQIIGVTLDAATVAEVGVAVTVVKGSYDALKGFIDSSQGFDFTKPGDHTLPHFEDVKIDWDH